jgi:hypothetical protein
MSYFPLSEDIVDILVKKTQSDDKHFFRVLTAYYMAKVASMMRCNIKTHERGIVPVSMYVLNLASSGFGKNFSTNIMEEYILSGFKERFMESLFPEVALKNLHKLAVDRSKITGAQPDELLPIIQQEFEMAGSLAFSFDSGTVPAIKQMRHKLLMANAGSMCFEGDEVGSNFTNNGEVLTAFLELYDIGKTKVKLTKNTTDNTRTEEIDGRTPTNLLLFGTPSKLLTSKIEDDFYAMLETGYARRLLFGYSQLNTGRERGDAAALYDSLVNSKIDARMTKLQDQFKNMSSLANFNKTLTMSKETSIKLIDYRLDCEHYSNNHFKDHEEIQKAEKNHRYFKAMKLAGAYAFCEGSPTLETKHLDYAIQLVEDSGDAFKAIMKRDRNYVRIAKYLSDIDTEVTQVDLMEDVPAYKGSVSQKTELMQLAVAWGYKNNIIIRRNYVDNIEFFIGESLEETDLSKMILSHSTHITEGFSTESAPFDQLHKLTTAPNMHYSAHRFRNGYRTSDNAIQGFNMIILDVDGGTNIDTANLLLKDYVHMISTTKRHTAAKNRYRIILPLSHVLQLDVKTYAEFMKNVMAWLPFDVDTGCHDIARKWETCKDAKVVYNTDADLVDATLFIPQTKKADTQQNWINTSSSMTNLERWFLLNTAEGNRNRMLIKYGFALLDNGYTLNAARDGILAFNAKTSDPLPEDEILMTIMVTLTKKFAEKDLL